MSVYVYFDHFLSSSMPKLYIYVSPSRATEPNFNPYIVLAMFYYYNFCFHSVLFIIEFFSKLKSVYINILELLTFIFFLSLNQYK